MGNRQDGVECRGEPSFGRHMGEKAGRGKLRKEDDEG